MTSNTVVGYWVLFALIIKGLLRSFTIFGKPLKHSLINDKDLEVSEIVLNDLGDARCCSMFCITV